MNLENVYFWTDTIKDWKHLFLKQNDCRMCVQYATEHVGEFYTKSFNKIKVQFGFLFYFKKPKSQSGILFPCPVSMSSIAK